MDRTALIHEIAALAVDASWRPCEIALLKGRWGQRATVEQLQRIHDSLWDATAAEVVDFEDEPAALGILADEVWLWEIPLRTEPQAPAVCNLRTWAAAVAVSQIGRAA